MKPYGYVRKDGEGLFIYGEHQFQNATDAELVPVYLHPKEWIVLTDEEIMECLDQVYGFNMRPDSFARAIETKLKELNT